MVFQLADGTLGDIYGRRPGLSFRIESVQRAGPCAGLHAEHLFIWLRLLQGMGAALLSSASLVLLVSAAPKELRASYLGVHGVAIYAGIACGPPVGGLLFLLCLVLLVCFIRRELRSPFLMVDVRMLRRNRVLSPSLVAAFVKLLLLFWHDFLFQPVFAGGARIQRAGSGPDAGWRFRLRCSRWQVLWRPVCAIATAETVLCGLGLLSVAFFDKASSLWIIAGAQCLIGAVSSIFALPNTIIMEAAGLVGTVRTADMLSNLIIITLTLRLFLRHEPVGRGNEEIWMPFCAACR